MEAGRDRFCQCSGVVDMLINVLMVVAAVLVLWKTAAWFIEGAVGVATLLRVPKMLIGLVLVSIATTSPELFTSLIAAVQGYPELALGNAVGSVIVDAGLALGLSALVATAPLVVDPAIFRISGRAVLLILAFAFLLVFDGTLGRIEGMALLGCYLIYIAVLYRHYRGRSVNDVTDMLSEGECVCGGAPVKWRRVLFLFGIGLAGVLVGSDLLVRGATGIALMLGLSPVVIGLTVTAIGTSMPEIATCIASALKREPAIGVGNIMGADILNICWVAGVSAMANPLTAEKQVLPFMFPCALIIVGSMVAMLHHRYRLVKWNGAVLILLYVLYVLTLLFFIAPSHLQPA